MEIGQNGPLDKPVQNITAPPPLLLTLLPPPPSDSTGDLPDGDADGVSEEGHQREGKPAEGGSDPPGGEDPQAQRGAVPRPPAPQVPRGGGPGTIPLPSRPGPTVLLSLSLCSLVSEVLEIEDTVHKLGERLAEAGNTLQSLLKAKAALEHHLSVKAHSLFLDQERCMSLRKSFPSMPRLVGYS